jgi:cytochrome c
VPARATLAALLTALVLMSSACNSRGERYREAARLTGGGDAQAGMVAIRHYGCNGCHMIPGIAGANGVVGPPLTGLAQRVYIAGVLPNTTENLMKWIQRPQQIVPRNAMPDMNVSEKDSRDIAAYLYSIH